MNADWLIEQKNAAYSERNKLVVSLARLLRLLGYNAGVGQHVGEDWDDGWRTVVFIDTPEGQLSWHFHDSEKHLLKDLPTYEGTWDGHTTEEKYERLAKLWRI